MRFLIDENLPPTIAERLRSLGHDARAVAELSRGVEDVALVELAIVEDRVIVTMDKGLAGIPFESGALPPGIILIRIPHPSRDLASFIVETISRRSDWVGHVATVTRTGSRFRRLRS